MTIPNCYECKFREAIVGSEHSKCVKLNSKAQIIALIYPSVAFEMLGVTGNATGRKRGWFSWPLDFDPVWLETCNGFEQREAVNQNMNEQNKSDSKLAVNPTNATNATN